MDFPLHSTGDPKDGWLDAELQTQANPRSSQGLMLSQAIQLAPRPTAHPRRQVPTLFALLAATSNTPERQAA